MNTPLGHNRCLSCAALSPLYQPWPTCRDCTEATCPACMVPGSTQEHEHDTVTESGASTVHHSESVQCRACYHDDPAICLWCNQPMDADHATESYCTRQHAIAAESSL